MRLILRKKAHQRLLRLYRALGNEIRCPGRMRFWKTMATLDVMQEQLIRRDFWEEKKRVKHDPEIVTRKIEIKRAGRGEGIASRPFF